MYFEKYAGLFVLTHRGHNYQIDFKFHHLEDIDILQIWQKSKGQGHQNSSNHIFCDIFCSNKDRDMELTPVCSAKRDHLEACCQIWRQIRQHDVRLSNFFTLVKQPCGWLDLCTDTMSEMVSSKLRSKLLFCEMDNFENVIVL